VCPYEPVRHFTLQVAKATLDDPRATLLREALNPAARMRVRMGRATIPTAVRRLVQHFNESQAPRWGRFVVHLAKLLVDATKKCESGAAATAQLTPHILIVGSDLQALTCPGCDGKRLKVAASLQYLDGDVMGDCW
jgi:hypothetical protein